LKKCIDRKGQLIEQTGENHPDVVMKMNGIRFNFEVTLMTQEDERFRYKSINAKEYIHQVQHFIRLVLYIIINTCVNGRHRLLSLSWSHIDNNAYLHYRQ
jgi:hypothetical protein